MFSTRKMALSSAAPDCSLRGFGPPELPSSPSAPCRETVCIYVYYVPYIYIRVYIYIYVFDVYPWWNCMYMYIYNLCLLYTSIIYRKVHTKHQETYEIPAAVTQCPSVDWITKSYLVGGAFQPTLYMLIVWFNFHGLIPLIIILRYLVGWWYTYPSEKYEFVSWNDEIPNWTEKSKECYKPPTRYPICCDSSPCCQWEGQSWNLLHG